MLSRNHPPHPNSKMKLPKLLRLPKSHRRQRSKARSEISPTEGQSEVDLAIPRPTESTPDLRPGASTFPTPSPSAAHDQGPNGVYISTVLSRTIHLRTLFASQRTPRRSEPNSACPWKRQKPPENSGRYRRARGRP